MMIDPRCQDSCFFSLGSASRRVAAATLICLLGVTTLAASDTGWIDDLGGAVTRDASGEVTGVDLRATWVTDTDLRKLTQFPKLTHLDLSLTRITDQGMQELKGLPGIVDLNLRFAEYVTDEGLAAVKEWKQLKRLNVHGTKISDTTLDHISGVTTIESVDVGSSMVTDVGIERLSSLPHLKELTIGGNELGDAGLQALRLLPSLAYLDLNGRQGTDSNVWTISMSDRGLEALPGFDGHFPDSTTHGQLSPLRVKNGYLTVTWRPNPGPFQDVSDHFLIGVNGAGEHADQKEVWDFRLAQAPFRMRAMGDSITAGFGYLGNGKPVQYNESDRVIDALALKACTPIDYPKAGALNNRCSSNSGEGRWDDGTGGRWSTGTGRGNTVAWPAKFAEDHRIPVNAGVFRPYKNLAVSGSAPENWIAGDGKPNFSDALDEIVGTNPDLTVLTIGANPILGKILLRPPDGVDGTKCGGKVGEDASSAGYHAEVCMRKLLDDYDVYRRLRAIYRRLLDAPNNHIVVAPYPSVYPPLQFYFATADFVNAYPPFVADRLAEMMNETVRRAVDDEAARARNAGEGNRLFMMQPKKFNIGYESWEQVINHKSGVPCTTRNLRYNVDGPTNQSFALQSAKSDLCPPSGGDDSVYTESLDGAHLSKVGARQYANALNDKVKDIGLPVDGRVDYQADWVSQIGPPALAPGEKGTATIRFRNAGTKTLSREGQKPTRCLVSRPLGGSSAWLDVNASNTVTNAEGQPIGVKIDQRLVEPGDDFKCTFHVVAPSKPYGRYPEYFSPVTEGNVSMLPRDDVFLPFSIADKDHVFFPGSSYSASFVNQEAPAVALAPGETNRVRFTFRNTGEATLYNDGANPTNCRPSKPRDRKSVWVDKVAPIEQRRVGPSEKFSCTIPIKAPSEFGVYNEYFSPVTEGKAWMLNDPPDGVSVRLTSADPDHIVWPPIEYGARWINQDYPRETLHPGEKGTVTFTWMNTRRSTLYNTGRTATYCRPSHPMGRESLWVKEPTLIDQSRVGPGELFTCTIKVTAPSQPGTYNEYFSLWNGYAGWMFNNGVDDVWIPLKSG